jgi:hypothetical protein
MGERDQGEADQAEVDREAEAQGDLDDRDLPPSKVVDARERERRAADEALGVEAPEGPNPS